MKLLICICLVFASSARAISCRDHQDAQKEISFQQGKITELQDQARAARDHLNDKLKTLNALQEHRDDSSSSADRQRRIVESLDRLINATKDLFLVNGENASYRKTIVQEMRASFNALEKDQAELVKHSFEVLMHALETDDLPALRRYMEAFNKELIIIGREARTSLELAGRVGTAKEAEIANQTRDVQQQMLALQDLVNGINSRKGTLNRAQDTAAKPNDCGGWSPPRREIYQ